MVTLSLTFNFDKVQRRLIALQEDIGRNALRSAVNKTAALGKTEMSKRIREEFNISADKVRNKLYVRKATLAGRRFSFEAELGSLNKKRALNLINFVEKSVSLVQAKRRAKKGTLGQIFVKVKRTGGKKSLGPKAFIGNNGRTVFMRTGTGRLPIKAVQTIDVPQMFNTRRINAKVQVYMVRRFPEVFEREAAFYIRRFNGN